MADVKCPAWLNVGDVGLSCDLPDGHDPAVYPHRASRACVASADIDFPARETVHVTVTWDTPVRSTKRLHRHSVDGVLPCCGRRETDVRQPLADNPSEWPTDLILNNPAADGATPAGAAARLGVQADSLYRHLARRDRLDLWVRLRANQ